MRSSHLKQYFTLYGISNPITGELPRRHSEIIPVELNTRRNTWQMIIMKFEVTFYSHSHCKWICYYAMYWPYEDIQQSRLSSSEKNFVLKNKMHYPLLMCIPEKKIIIANTCCYSFKKIEREFNCVSTLCCLLCLLKTPDEILNFYSSLFVKIILFSIKSISVLQNPSAFTDSKCNYINPSW